MLLSKKTGMHFKNKQMAHASHYRQNSLTHSNSLVEVKQQRRNWKHTSAFWLKRAYMWHVKLDGTANVTAVRKLTSVKITKGCLLRKAFGRVSYQPKQKCMSEERTQYRGEEDPRRGSRMEDKDGGKCRMWGPYKNCVHGGEGGKNPNKKPTSAPVLLFEYKIKGQAKVNKCTSTKEANTVVALHLRRFYSLCTCWNLFRIFRKN